MQVTTRAEFIPYGKRVSSLLALGFLGGLLGLQFQARADEATRPAPIGTSSASFIPGALVQADPSEIIEGPQLPHYSEELKKIFPSADSFKISDVLPLQAGGTSFVGLVARLLGEGPDRTLEGLHTRRYIYIALEKDKAVGVAHGSTINVGASSVDVFVYYSAGGTIRQVQLLRASDTLMRELTSGGYLKQFEGFTTEDFEMIRGRRHRIKSKGAFFAKVHKPGSGALRNSFDKIIRAVRFNAAFMDVAYFITQHPDMADQPLEEFPDEVKVTTGVPLSGPEAFARAQTRKRNSNRDPASNDAVSHDE
jgi:hypothetical protein